MSAERFPCCVCCPGDPSWHADNPKDTHEVPCDTCGDRGRALTAEAEVKRLRTALARIEPTLSLLHHRGLVDSPNNRDDVREALDLCRNLLEGGEQR